MANKLKLYAIHISSEIAKNVGNFAGMQVENQFIVVTEPFKVSNHLHSRYKLIALGFDTLIGANDYSSSSAWYANRLKSVALIYYQIEKTPSNLSR